MQNNLIPLLTQLGYALLMTIVIEEAVAVFFFGARWTGYLLVLLVNVATNPVINVVYQWLNSYFRIPPYGWVVIVMELAVVWVEYRLISHGLNSNAKRWFILSLVANTASYVTGLLTI
jgi:hypothetical protein